MIKRRIFLTFLLFSQSFLLLISGNAIAQKAERQELDKVRASVGSAVHTHLSSIYGAEIVGTDVRFKISNLDSRLQLAKCNEEIKTELKEASYGSRSLSAKVSCASSSARWTIYVPVAIDVFTQVAVSTRSLHRGESIQKGDFVYKRSNTSRIAHGYLDQNYPLEGMEVRRAIRAGSVIKKLDLKEPTLINKGETVQLTASSGSLMVKSEGTALSNGHLGQQIRVQNIRSQRIVEARVTGKGTAEITL